jgi:hypothetical protein
MSTVNANFSINNLPQVDRLHNEAIKAPLVDQAQKEQIIQNERIHNLHRPLEAQDTSGILVDQKKKNEDKTKKRNVNRNNKDVKNKNGKKRDNRSGNGLFVDIEC